MCKMTLKVKLIIPYVHPTEPEATFNSFMPRFMSHSAV